MAKFTNPHVNNEQADKTVRIAYRDWYALKQLNINTSLSMAELLSVAVPLLFSQYPEYYKHLPDGYDVMPYDNTDGDEDAAQS